MHNISRCLTSTLNYIYSYLYAVLIAGTSPNHTVNSGEKSSPSSSTKCMLSWLLVSLILSVTGIGVTGISTGPIASQKVYTALSEMVTNTYIITQLVCVLLGYIVPKNVTRSVKTFYNVASWNLQYKPLIVIGKICKFQEQLCISWWRKNLTWISSCSLVSLQLKGLWAMAVCLCYVETIVHDWSFFRFRLGCTVIVKKGDATKKLAHITGFSHLWQTW